MCQAQRPLDRATPAGHWRRAAAVLALVALVGVVAGCGGGTPSDEIGTATGSTAGPVTPTEPASTPGSPPAGGDAGAGPQTPVPSTLPPAPGAGSESSTPVAGQDPLPTRPDWLGLRVLPTMADGSAIRQTTPPALADRRFATIDLLPPPADGAFHATIEPIASGVLARSTWTDACPVTVDELRYLTLGFWGFDGRAHTGEMIVNAGVADDVATAFASLFEARFPIEEMRVTTTAEVDAPPIGDGNNTSAFVCRAAVGSTRFSEHAYGLAIDINPFHNPYVKGDLVLPELAGVYTDRSDARPGMIMADGPVVAAFDAIGWGWGGRWNSLKDYQHMARNDR